VRGGVLECGVSAASVVEHFDVLENRVRQLDPGLPLLAVQQFDLHRRPESVSITALSRPSPTVPNDGNSPAERIFCVNTHEVD
jgi:hypothetical protein